MKKRQEYNKQFSKIRNKKKLSAWLMRQYFDPAQHVNSPWYSKRVTSDNVLLYVSDPSNKFPLTPVEIADMFKCIQSFKTSLKKSEKELGPNLGVAEPEKPAKQTAKYQTGEVTLVNVGKALGGLTPTMINKLSTSGMDKIRRLSNGIPIRDLPDEQADQLDKFIMDCRIEAAIEYASLLKASEGNIEKFMTSLVKSRLVTTVDLKTLPANEKLEIVKLYAKDQGDVVTHLLRDISQDANVYKSYQCAVSRKAFPERKPGRPKKDLSYARL